MAVSVDMFMREGQRFEIVGDGELRALWIRSADGFVEATLHFGFAEGRPSLSLAVDQLDALIIASTMLRNRIAAPIGAGLTEYRPADELVGPDDPTDEPTDEPATVQSDEFGFTIRRRSDGATAEYGPAGDRLTEWREPTDEPTDAPDDPELRALRHAGVRA